MENLKEMTISQIANEIRKDWKQVNYGARPYLEVMRDLETMQDSYGGDSAKCIVRYFLSNATSYRGEKAREIKKHLNKLLK